MWVTTLAWDTQWRKGKKKGKEKKKKERDLRTECHDHRDTEQRSKKETCPLRRKEGISNHDEFPFPVPESPIPTMSMSKILLKWACSPQEQTHTHQKTLWSSIHSAVGCFVKRGQWEHQLEQRVSDRVFREVDCLPPFLSFTFPFHLSSPPLFPPSPLSRPHSCTG